MIEVVLTKGTRILSFDGRVLEDFYVMSQNSQRIHVRHVDRVEIKEGRKGARTLDVRSVGRVILIKLDEAEWGPVDQLVAQLNAARG